MRAIQDLTNRLEVRLFNLDTGEIWVVRWPNGEKERARREVEGLLGSFRHFVLISHEGF